jgi:hypothetical protein
MKRLVHSFSQNYALFLHNSKLYKGCLFPLTSQAKLKDLKTTLKGEISMVNKVEVIIVSTSPLPPVLHGFRLSTAKAGKTNSYTAVEVSSREIVD